MLKLFFVAIPLVVSCGPSYQSADYDVASRSLPNIDSYFVIPEYEKTTGIMLNTSYKMFGKMDDNHSFKVTYGHLSREYKTLFTSLVESLRDVNIFVYAQREIKDEDKKNFNLDTPEIQFLRDNVMPTLKNRGTNIVLRESGLPDAWTRDYGGFSARNPVRGEMVLKEYLSQMAQSKDAEKRGYEENRDLADQLKVPLRSIRNAPKDETSEQLTGGGIMTDNQGRCFVAPVEPDQSWGCTEVIPFKSLPYDGTGHIDLFAKLLSDRNVAVADFEQDGFLWLKEPEITVKKCQDQDCSDTKIVESKEATYLFEKSSSGQDRLFSMAEIKKLVESRYPSMTIAPPKARGEVQTWTEPNLKKLAQQTAAAFRAKGFDVTMIKNPTPVAYASVMRTLDANGKVKNELVTIQVVYRSHINSLIANGRAFVPVFHTARPESNQSALEIYRKAGFTPIPVPMDYHAILAGAVHCLTHDLH